MQEYRFTLWSGASTPPSRRLVILLTLYLIKAVTISSSSLLPRETRCSGCKVEAYVQVVLFRLCKGVLDERRKKSGLLLMEHRDSQWVCGAQCQPDTQSAAAAAHKRQETALLLSQDSADCKGSRLKESPPGCCFTRV